MAMGKDYELYITANGLVGGAQKRLAFQGDASVDFGKSVSREVYKHDESYSYQEESGFAITVACLHEAPMQEALQLIWDAIDNEDTVYAYYQSSRSGGLRWHGLFRPAITEKADPVNGTATLSVTLSQAGAYPTRAVVS